MSNTLTRVMATLAATVVTCSPAGAAGLAISPSPNTPDASPATQISILGAPRPLIRSVSVVASRTGNHTGHLHAYRAAPGASFVPSVPFAQGERVAVSIRITGRRPIRFAFTVAQLGPIGPPLNIPVIQPAKLDRFVSAPGLLPPRITVNYRAPGLVGDIFLTPLPAPIIHPDNPNAISIKPVGPGGPMIVNARGQLVWFHQLAPPLVAAALTPARLGRRPVLTWWQGTVTTSAFGQGVGVIADTSYRTLRVVHAGNGYQADIHEFRLTPRGDALFVAVSPVLVHLPGTPAGHLSPVQDSIAQEIDIRTGLVEWEWHGLGHIPLAQSDVTPKTSPVFDAYHFNSLEPLPDGHVLISARDTSAIYDVAQAGGQIVWRLGGKASSFHMGAGAGFHFQHDAHMLPGHRISLFDDEAGPPIYAHASRGLVLTLDRRRHRATVARQLHRGGPSLAESEGSFQTLPGGGAFVGFGAAPWISQFSARGRLLFDASLPVDDGSYRSLRFPWHATPRTRPLLVAQRASPTAVSLYASWNGATAVARWQILAGSGTGSLPAVRSVADRGFETRFAVRGSAVRFAVRALAADGRVLGTSSAVSAP
ncbi:MAG: arylsulfotransferase family protein [Solirubrobacteraceae bacterium]